MDGGEGDSRIARDNVFGAVAMMSVEIPDGNALSAVLQRILGGDGDVAEITKSHRLVARGVMSRRPHQTESALALQRRMGRIDRRPCGPQSVLVNIRICRCVRIEIMGRIFYPGEMFA